MEKISVLLEEIENVKKSAEVEVAQYESAREEELIQKLHDANYKGNEAEAKKIEAELIEISKQRKHLFNSHGKLGGANRKLENEISNRIKEAEGKQREVEDKIKQINEIKTQKQELIAINKDELTRMKQNMDMLAAHREIPNWDKHYEDIRNKMKPLLEKNRNLSKEIMQLEGEMTNLSNSVKEYSIIIEEYKNRDFEKIIKREEEQEKKTAKKVEPQTATDQKTESGTDTQAKSEQGTDTQVKSEQGTDTQAKSEQGTDTQAKSEQGTDNQAKSEQGTDTQAKSEQGTDTQAKSEQGTDTQAKSEQGTDTQVASEQGTDIETSSLIGTINEYFENRDREDLSESDTVNVEEKILEDDTEQKTPLNFPIIIHPEKYDKTILEYNGEEIELLNNSDSPVERDSISDEILEKLVQAKGQTDPLVVKKLREKDEALLKDYLDICIAYKNGEKIDAEKLDKFPRILYKYAKDLRKSDRDTSEKLEVLEKAEATKKMFEEMNYDKVQLKMGILDKMYFGFNKFINKFKKQPKQITEGSAENKVEQVEESSEQANSQVQNREGMKKYRVKVTPLSEFKKQATTTKEDSGREEL